MKKIFRTAALVAATTLVAAFAQLPASARADTKPVNEADPSTPVTVSADPLPTVQIDGVAWTQRVIGNTVYVGGSFTTARPAGAAPGVNTVARANLLAYDITTGNLIDSWAPSTNGDVLTIVPSPDNTKLYIGGNFTQMNGQIRNRIAAIDRATGALVNAFQPKPDASVRAIIATNDTVYMGGLLTAVSGVARTRVAAVRASDGALLSWAPNAQGGSVHSLIMSPDSSKVIVGGSFTTMNGSGNPGYGLAAIDPLTGASLPFPANSLIRDAGANSAITGLSSDADSLYASGFVFGAGGNLEGISRINWSDLTVKWVEDCHGDTYASYPKGDVIYASSHAHYCGNLPDGFPQTNPWTMYYGTAFSKAVVGTLKADPLGYFNWVGNPAPNLLKWLPLLTQGTYTGQGQAGWHVTGNANYVSYGGEFLTANGAAQQGLVRYAVRDIAPNKVGPVFTQSKFNPTLTSFVAGTVRIAWRANWDRDNEKLTYKVIRDGIIASPIHTVSQLSSEWNRPMMGYTDTGLIPGREYRYRVFAADPYGNEARSETIAITASSDGTLSSYAQSVLDDGAANYWRLGESPATTVNDWAGFSNATARAGVTGGQAGAITGDANPASSFSGTSTGFAATASPEPGPNTFTLETWVKTSSTAGGKIIGFGSANTGNSGSYDRHVYVDSAGRITFGVYSGAARTVTSPKSYRDGQWHHVVASLGSGGMALYVDGLKVGARFDTTAGQAYSGYWRLGGDSIGSWPSAPSSNYLNGQIDDVAVYPSVLSGSQIREHYLRSGRTPAGSTPPADAYGAAVHAADPEFYWRLAETSGTVANDVSAKQLAGTYNGNNTKGQASGIGLVGDTSVLFNGTNPANGSAATQLTFTNPTVYAEELWFKTNTSTGGKLIGFSSSATGSSANYDRHVYMFNDGRLSFGTNTGVQNVVNSVKSYNDNRWHHLVAQQDASGMKLFVDAQLVGSNPQTGAQNFTGYWRIGGDNTWGGSTSTYFRGTLDEVAVYSHTLSNAEIASHFTKGGGDLPNVAPTAAFTSTVTKLSVAFDASPSSDSDGTVASYLWDFGDGQTSTVAAPTHAFAGAGPQTVKLTVTDNDGATDTVTKTVTTVANQAPTAGFAATVDRRDVTFDSSASADADGTIVSYLWDFGDGTTSTMANPSHQFADASTYTVTLTVTDDNGATGTVTKPVVTVDNASPTAAFTSSVDELVVSFDASGSADPDGSVASYAWDFGDGETGTGASPKHTYAAAGSFDVVLTVTDNDGATDSVTRQVSPVAPVGPIAGDAFGRTATGGWGSADTGGAWTRYGTSSLFSVGSGVGQIKLAAAGSGPRLALESVSSANTDATVKVSLDKLPDGSGGFVSLGARTIGTSDYRAKVKVSPTGVLTLYLVKVVSGAESTLTSVQLGSAFSYTVGSTLNIRVQATGTSPTTLRAKAWKSTQAEPASWQVTTTDSTAGLQSAGGVGVATFLSSTSTVFPTVSFDDLVVTVP